MRPHPESPHGKAGETGAVGQDILKVVSWNRLGLGHTVHVNELCQDELDLVVFQ